MKLIVAIHGACALVPTPDKKKARILLGRFDKLPRGLKKPVSYVQFHKDSLADTNKRKGLHAPPEDVKEDFRDRRHFVLDDEFLTINAGRVVEPHKTLEMNEKKDPIAPTPTDGDKFSLHWLPHIEHISPGAGDVEPALLKIPLTARPGLAARLDITQGLLETAGVSQVEIDFIDAAGTTVSTSIARDMVLTVETEDDFVVLESRPLRTGRQDPERSIRLQANGSETVMITMGNEPEEDIYAPIPEITDADTMAREEALEFGLYYRLSKNPPRDPRLPHVHGRRPSGQLCAGGYMNPAPDPTS